MYFIYILQSEISGRYYIGHTNNLSLRLSRHNENKVPSTKNRGPWNFVYIEKYNTRSEAMLREKYLKSLKSKKAINQLIKSTSSKLSDKH